MMSWTGISALATATDTTAPYPSGSPAGVEMFDGATYFTTNAEIAGRYTITRTVADSTDHPGEAKTITIVVRWQSYDNRWHQRSFTGIYCQNGLYDYYYTVAHP